MENFMKMLSTQAILLVYMAVGFYCRKRGIIEKKMQGKLTDFVLRITLPCMIFNSFSMHITLDMLKQAALCLGVAFFICFAAWLGGKVVYNMYPKEKKSVLQYATLVNNAAFLGLPIVKAVLGEAGMFLASIFIIPNRIFMWTAGVSIFTAEADKKAAFKKVMLNPCVIVIFIGLFRSFTDFTLPEFLAKSITGLGNCTTPLSMVLIGTMMTELTLASFKDWSTVYLAFMRLVAPVKCRSDHDRMRGDSYSDACGKHDGASGGEIWIGSGVCVKMSAYQYTVLSDHNSDHDIIYMISGSKGLKSDASLLAVV